MTTMKLRIVDRGEDHFVVYTDGPARVEVSLVRSRTGYRVIAHGYTGTNLDLQQEPSITYDGTERDSMVDQG